MSTGTDLPPITVLEERGGRRSRGGNQDINFPLWNRSSLLSLSPSVLILPVLTLMCLSEWWERTRVNIFSNHNLTHFLCLLKRIHHEWRSSDVNFNTTGRILFYKGRRKILENCRCILVQFITMDKARPRRGGGKLSMLWKSQKDEDLKLAEVSHTLGGSVINTYLDS